MRPAKSDPRNRQKMVKPTTTPKALSRILGGEMIEGPIVQVLAYKKVNSPENNGVVKYRFILSDGDNMYQCCIIDGDEHVERIQKGEFERYTLIRLDQYTAKEVPSNRVGYTQQAAFLMTLIILSSSGYRDHKSNHCFSRSCRS